MKKISLLFLFITINVLAQPNEERLSKLRGDTKIDSQDKAVFDLLDEFYMQGLQSEAGDLQQGMIKKMTNLYENKNTKNRHLLLLFMAYQDRISQTAAAGKRANSKFQVDIMTDLAYEFKNIFNKVPAIIYIYKFEALDTNGEKEEAAKVLDEGLAEYPDSVPLQVYKFLVTKDETIKTNLIAKHSNHWMVKQFDIK